MQVFCFEYLFLILNIFVVLQALVKCGQDGSTKQQADERSAKNRLIVISTTSNLIQDSYLRFKQSIESNGLKLESLRDETKEISSYKNGLSTTDPKGELRRQFEALQEKLLKFKDDESLVLMLVEGANAIINGDEREILARFNAMHTSSGARILFAADVTCWPDATLAERYPPLSSANSESRGHAGQRFLDSRSLIGFAPDLWNLIELSKSFKQTTADPNKSALIIEQVNYDFQLYSTHVYFSQEHRQRLHMALDHRSSLFENLDSNHVLASNRSEPTSLMAKVELEFISNTGGDFKSSGKSTPDGVVNLRNLLYDTRPLVVHGSGSSARIELNSLGNYLGKAWSPNGGCLRCNESRTSLASIKDSELPRVLVAVFIEEPTPFMDGFFGTLKELNYPKDRLHLFIYNPIEYHEKHVNDFITSQGAKYASLELVDLKLLNTSSSDSLRNNNIPSSEWQARDFALSKCKRLACDYLLALDSTARLELPDSLRLLIETNRTIVAPLLSRPGKLWSNFWGAITRDGYYARSDDYVELVARKRLGVWNVPLLMNAYLIEGNFLRRQLEQAERAASKATLALDNGRGSAGGAIREEEQEAKNKEAVVVGDRTKNTNGGESGSEITTGGEHNSNNNTNHNHYRLAYHDPRYPSIKPALIFARNLRYMNQFQYVTNEHEFGHLVDASEYNISRLYPDFYQLIQNKPDWEREYLHENYTDLFDERDEDESNYPNRIRLEEPCQDVYWFPLVSDKFANQLVEMMEQFGQWSAGKNHDPRIEGGYESVPTRDIHFRQVGLHDMWLYFLREYIMPIQLKEYIGYEHDPPRTDLAFVVRYHPEEQPSLRPHHDSSTYTLNIALNTPGVDYEGGGCRFVRYNCSVTQSRKGWALIHPGRLTHYHEGLPVTNGTRYILVTFVDP